MGAPRRPPLQSAYRRGVGPEEVRGMSDQWEPGHPITDERTTGTFQGFARETVRDAS
jgi:hypothetical protein